MIHKTNPHMDGKHTALGVGVGGNPSVIRNVKFLNLCLLRTVFQGIQISPWPRRRLGSIGPLLICFLGSCSLQVFIIQQTGSLFSTLSGPSYCPTNTLL